MVRHKTNMDNLKNETSNFAGGGGKDWLSLADGRNIIRILWPWSSEGKFFQRVGFHRKPGDFKGDKVICPNFTFGKDTCPICKKSKGVYDKMGKDVAKLYWPGKRAYLNVLDMKAGDGIVKVLEVGPSILNPILNLMAEEDSDDLIDPNLGFNVLIRKYKEGDFTKYETQVKPGVYDIEKHGYDVDALCSQLHDLGALVKMPEADDFYDILDAINSKAFEGGSPDGDVPSGPGGNQSRDDGDDLPAGPGAAKPQDQSQTTTLTTTTKLDDDGDDLPVGPGAGQQTAQTETTKQPDPDETKTMSQPNNDGLDMGDLADINMDVDLDVDDIPF